MTVWTAEAEHNEATAPIRTGDIAFDPKAIVQQAAGQLSRLPSLVSTGPLKDIAS
jgi:hypothetical protein